MNQRYTGKRFHATAKYFAVLIGVLAIAVISVAGCGGPPKEAAPEAETAPEVGKVPSTPSVVETAPPETAPAPPALPSPEPPQPPTGESPIGTVQPPEVGLPQPAPMPAPSGSAEAPRRFGPDAFFSNQDKNGDGQLSSDEIPDRLRERIMSSDSNNDGVLSKEEWDAGRERMRANMWNDIFTRFDKNSDGKLTSDELPEPARERFMQADTDADGAISKEEMESFRPRPMERMPERPQEPPQTQPEQPSEEPATNVTP